jgi:hypothetical protein
MAVIAFWMVATQLSMIGIAMVNLEDSSSEEKRPMRIGGLEAFREENLSPGSPKSGQKSDQRLRQYNHKIHLEPQQHQQPPASDRHHSKPESEEPVVRQAQPPHPRELIHIVHTRFMQHQGNLTTLGVARLKQFLAFCLPTMVHQTTQDFLWIIKVDPLLETNSESRSKVLEPLLEAIEGQENKNVYVVASNYNFNVEGHVGSWRDGQEGEELVWFNSTSKATPTNGKAPSLAKVYTGDMATLKRAYDLREALPVLETRLDADDGLSRKYLERVQKIALDRFVGPLPTERSDNVKQTAHHNPEAESYSDGSRHQNVTLSQPSPKPQWLYWCSLTQIEWHSEKYSYTKTTGSQDMWELRNNEKKYYGNSSLGYIVPIANHNFCITPGLTVGYGVGVAVESVPRFQHTSLFPSLGDKYKLCHSEEDQLRPHKGPCLECMGKPQKSKEGKKSYSIETIRSRTLTSAGMDGVGNIDAGNHGKKNTAASGLDGLNADKTERLLWLVLTTNFAIDPSEVEAAQQFLSEHRLEIALENSLGQCSTGHSCKDKARERLQKIIGKGQTERRRSKKKARKKRDVVPPSVNH